MLEITDPSAEGIEQLKLEEFTEKAYLEYSMYVILDRALPHIGDGLKPVQRRIVYAMSELGLKASAKYKKSARTVGDVLGKFHPHGDSACYEAMVLMAQPFSYRYPLVDGQGNWGSPDDPKSFAAMRYTESRLAKYADVLLGELGQGTADWVPNFDGTMEEPKVLPSRLPNVLLNGTTGIAVGMATDIPPHNLKELVSACTMLLDHPDADLDAIYSLIPAPDFPTEAEIITPEAELKKLYRSGTGGIRMRAVHLNENGDIIVTALPHQVSGNKVIEQIAAQMQAKKLPMVGDLRDESDHENPTRIVITPRSNRVDREALMKHLYATTDLEKTYRVNMNVIGLDGKPKVRGLVSMLNEWISFRKQTITRRLDYRLDKVKNRLHILDGLLLAFLNIDEVIDVIRNEDEPKQVFMARFGLSETQAEAILELRLRHLAKLEEMKIRGEQDDLSKERDAIEKILGSEKQLIKLMKKELKEDAENYGDMRRSPVVAREEAQAMDPNAMTPAEPVTVILSEKGWIRSAKGHEFDVEKLNYKSGDAFQQSVLCKTNELVVLLDSTGRSYSIPAHSLPSARGQGEPVTGRLQMPGGAGIIEMFSRDPESKMLITSDAGYGFLVTVKEFFTKNKTGKAILTVPAGAKPIAPLVISNLEEELVVAVTNEARMLVFPLKAMPELTKGKGNQIISIPAAKMKTRADFMSAIVLLSPGDQLLVHAGKRYLNFKFNELDEYKGERGRRGQKLPRGFQNVDRLEVVRKEKEIEPEVEQKELF